MDKFGKDVEMAAREAERFAKEQAEMIARETEKAAREAQEAVERAAREAKQWFEKDARFGAEKLGRDTECGLRAIFENVNDCLRRSRERYDRDMGRNGGNNNNEPPKPCPLNEFENTNWNDEGQGSIFYLDRHNLECGPNSFIGGFKLERWNGKIRYRYSCIESDADNLGDCYDDYTPLNDVIHWDDRHTAHWLDRHDVKCRDGYGLKKFQMQRGGDRVRYAYKCCSGATNCFDMQTPPQDQGTHETVFFDRLIVAPGTNRILSSFKLETLPDNKWRYNYRSCQIPGNLKVKADTGCQDAAEGNIWYLDRHKIKCKENSAIAKFKLTRPSETQKDSIKYDYTCIYSPEDISNDCSNHETPRNDVWSNERDSIMWLDRHNLNCENGKVMNSFEVARDANKIFFKYTCCKANVQSVQTFETQYKQSEGQTYYLDRHDVDAKGWNVISGFVLKVDNGNWRYKLNSAQLRSAAKICPVNNRDTGFNDEGDGNVWFIDRHNIECDDNQFINYFKFVRSGQNKFRYEYSCISYSTHSPQCYEHNTGLQDVGNGGNNAVDYLDRHNIECNPGFALQKFKFNRFGDRGVFNFKCCKADFTSCENKETAADGQGDKKTVYLDRQPVDAKDNGAISQFRLKANLPDNKLKYEFRSCKVRC
jgi:hypothetical protein